MTAPDDPGDAVKVAVRPRRIQRQRTKGWRMPEGAIYVGRPTLWGNPYGKDATFGGRGGAAALVEAYEWWIANRLEIDDRYEAGLRQIRGRDLACWCPLDQPCHADVLLELANR